MPLPLVWVGGCGLLLQWGLPQQGPGHSVTRSYWVLLADLQPEHVPLQGEYLGHQHCSCLLVDHVHATAGFLDGDGGRDHLIWGLALLKGSVPPGNEMYKMCVSLGGFNLPPPFNSCAALLKCSPIARSVPPATVH